MLAALHESRLDRHAPASPPRCEAGLCPAVHSSLLGRATPSVRALPFRCQGRRPEPGAQPQINLIVATAGQSPASHRGGKAVAVFRTTPLPADSFSPRGLGVETRTVRSRSCRSNNFRATPLPADSFSPRGLGVETRTVRSRSCRSNNFCATP